MKKITRKNNIIRTLSKLGECSRRQALILVQGGRVRINGQAVLDPGKMVKAHDSISIDGTPVSEKKKQYILLYKPAGYITTRKDELNRKTVYELLSGLKEWVSPVGRLDKESEGLLILTNDTEFGNILTDPKYRIPRTYKVTINGILTPEDVIKILHGVIISQNEVSKPTQIKILNIDRTSTVLEITLIEGKNREIRRLFDILGKPVLRLIRTAFGPYRLRSIKPGQWHEIPRINPPG